MRGSMFSKELLDKITKSKIVAGFSVQNLDDAVPIAKSLMEGGINVIELTLRTKNSLKAVEMIAKSVQDMVIGVGTILTTDQLFQVKNNGAHFGVSPGLNKRVLQYADEIDFSFAPGIATPSDLDCAIDMGYRFVKFFPAEGMGGVNYLKSISAPFNHLDVKYFPLGGINSNNMNEYLNIDNVIAIGGSWIVKDQLVLNKQWKEITKRALEVRNIINN